jgi:hypothetical protein
MADYILVRPYVNYHSEKTIERFQVCSYEECKECLLKMVIEVGADKDVIDHLMEKHYPNTATAVASIFLAWSIIL